jgi:surface carbohydrate biosynthesis protein (TIGR04326 family)
LYFSCIFIFNLKWIKKQLKYTYNGTTYDVWDLFKGDFYQSFSGSNLVSSIIYILSFKKLLRSINPKAKIITVCEMQWWEKALYLEARKNSFITIGYQHCQMPTLLLNYFSAPEEIADDTAFRALGFPDYLATVGKITRKMFIDSGWPQNRVFAWGAQRFESIRNLESLFVPWQNKTDIIVCALPVDENEAKTMLALLRDTFICPFPSYKIALKSHPAVNLAKIIKEMRLELSEEVFIVADDPLDMQMKKAKAMIVTKSSSCFYALAAGSYVIVPRFLNTLDCNPLSYLTNFPVYSYSAPELRGICDQIILSRERPVFFEQGKDFLRNYLYFPESNAEYLNNIRCIEG